MIEPLCVCVSLGEGDTFEDLLERQLRLNPHQVTSYDIIHRVVVQFAHFLLKEAVSPRQNLPVKPHPFLRRGEGLARFHIQPKEQRSPKKSKTHQSHPKALPTNSKTAQAVSADTTRGNQSRRDPCNQPLVSGGAAGQSVEQGTTPLLLSSLFPSEESFIFRGKQRVKVSPSSFDTLHIV